MKQPKATGISIRAKIISTRLRQAFAAVSGRHHKVALTRHAPGSIKELCDFRLGLFAMKHNAPVRSIAPVAGSGIVV